MIRNLHYFFLLLQVVSFGQKIARLNFCHPSKDGGGTMIGACFLDTSYNRRNETGMGTGVGDSDLLGLPW